MAEACIDKKESTDSHLAVDKLKQLKKAAYALVDSSLKLDAQHKPHEALRSYQEAKEALLQAIRFHDEHKTELQASSETKKILTDLSTILKQSEERIRVLNNQLNDEVLLNDFENILNAQQEDPNIDKKATVDEANAVELCNILKGAQVFYIASDGSVSTPYHQSVLNVYEFT